MGQSLNPQRTQLIVNKTQPKSVQVHTDERVQLIQISDDKLTSGWLLSEVIRGYRGRGNIIALRTAKDLELLDMWLMCFERKLQAFTDKEHLLAVYEEPVPRSLSLAHFVPIKVIGKGAFSRVVLVRKKDTGNLYAVKTISKDFVLQENKVSQIINEKDVLARIKCPFIVSLHWVLQTQHELHIVLDFCPGGELFFHLQNIGRLTEPQARFYFAEILAGLEYLHYNNIIYRDLKPENILLDIDGHIKITDFGLSKELSYAKERSFSFCGSPEYMSPEMLRREGHGREIDFYSLGALLYEMLTGLPPFYHQNRAEMYANILNQSLHLPDYLSKEAKLLLIGLLNKDHRLRLGIFEGISEIKRHQWLAGMDWELLYKKAYTPPFRPKIRASNFDPEYTREPLDETEYNLGVIYEPEPDCPFYKFNVLPTEAFEERIPTNKLSILKDLPPRPKARVIVDCKTPTVPPDELKLKSKKKPSAAVSKQVNTSLVSHSRSFRSMKIDEESDEIEEPILPEKIAHRAREPQLL